MRGTAVLAAKIVAIVAVLICSILLTSQFLSPHGSTQKPEPVTLNIHSATALESAFPPGHTAPFTVVEFSQSEGNPLWDACSTPISARLPRSAGPTVEADYTLRDTSKIVLMLGRSSHADVAPFAEALRHRPATCPSGGLSVLGAGYEGEVETRIDVPAMGDASVEYRGTDMAYSKTKKELVPPGLYLTSTHLAALSGDWYLTADAGAADEATFSQALPVIFSSLNERLGSHFVYRPGNAPNANCGMVSDRLASGTAVAAKLYGSAVMIHDAACRADARTIVTWMSDPVDFDHEVMSHGAAESRIRRDPSQFSAIRMALEAPGDDRDHAVVRYRHAGTELSFGENSAFAATYVSHPTPGAGKTNLLGSVDWTSIAKRDLRCGALSPEVNEMVAPRTFDITGDGIPDEFVVMDCRTEDASSDDQVEVFDGRYPPPALHEIGTLTTIGQGIRVRSLAFSGPTVRISGPMLQPTDSLACPSVKISQLFTYGQGRLSAGPQAKHRLPAGQCG